MNRWRYGVSLLLLWGVFFFVGLSGAEKPGAKPGDTLRRAAQLEKAGKSKDAAKMLRTLSGKSLSDPESAAAFYLIWRKDFESVKPGTDKFTRKLKDMEKATISSGNELRTWYLYVLLAFQNPSEPMLERVFREKIAAADPRISHVARFGESVRLKGLKRYKESLKSFHEALQGYDRLCRPSSGSSASGDGDEDRVDPILPWSRAEIQAQIAEIDAFLRNQDDDRLHADALRLYRAKKYSEAKALFSSIHKNFPESRHLESCVFHIAACDAALYSPGKRNRFDYKKFAEPLHRYRAAYPLEPGEGKAPGQFHGEAWILIGDCLFTGGSSSLEDVKNAWEEAAIGFLACDPQNKDQLSNVYFRLAALAHYQSDFDTAIRHYKTDISYHPQNHTYPEILSWSHCLIGYCEAKLVTIDDKIRHERKGDNEFERRFHFAWFALMGGRRDLVEHFNDPMTDRAAYPKFTDEQIIKVLVIQILGKALEDKVGEGEYRVYEPLAALIKKYPKNSLTPYMERLLIYRKSTTTIFPRKHLISEMLRFIKKYPNHPATWNVYGGLIFYYVRERDYGMAIHYTEQFKRVAPDACKKFKYERAIPLWKRKQVFYDDMRKRGITPKEAVDDENEEEFWEYDRAQQQKAAAPAKSE